ncbi:MAG: hypothetical protein IJN80_06350 [Clostridia bacterium]|nr:hypothetical protein [Clostridia bacterium]
MAEPIVNGSFNVGNNDNMQFQESPSYPGSWQQILASNLGEYCYIDFLIGTQNLVRKEGILYNVGVSFVVLYEPKSMNYDVCDLYSIKFVTFPAPGSVAVNKNIRRRV